MKNMSVDKKVKILVFGIFFAVVVLVGTTYAFFTYTRSGSELIIRTGDLEFAMIDGSSVSLTNMFPQSDEDGNKNDAYNFTVTNNSNDGFNLVYDVFLVDNNKENGVSYFNNENIKYSLKKNDNYVIGDNLTGYELSSVNGFDTGVSTGEGVVLDNQSIVAKSTDSYELRIWISDAVVYTNTIDDNGLMVGAYNDFKYSLKVRVDAVS